MLVSVIFVRKNTGNIDCVNIGKKEEIKVEKNANLLI